MTRSLTNWSLYPKDLTHRLNFTKLKIKFLVYFYKIIYIFFRIIAAGAEVTESDGEYRVHVPDHGSINMTRAIGDVQLKKYGITAEVGPFF